MSKEIQWKYVYQDFSRPHLVADFLNEHPEYVAISMMYVGGNGWGSEWSLLYKIPVKKTKYPLP